MLALFLSSFLVFHCWFQPFICLVKFLVSFLTFCNNFTSIYASRLKQHMTVSNRGLPTATVAPSYVIQLKSGLKIEIHCRDLSSSSVDMIIIPADEHLRHTLNSVRELISKGTFVSVHVRALYEPSSK